MIFGRMDDAAARRAPMPDTGAARQPSAT